ncbi:unnamed protein product [Hapterophycus canaliculatus]
MSLEHGSSVRLSSLLGRGWMDTCSCMGRKENEGDPLVPELSSYIFLYRLQLSSMMLPPWEQSLSNCLHGLTKCGIVLRSSAFVVDNVAFPGGSACHFLFSSAPYERG